MYYVTYYRNYPIFEPAEGGYYYSGREIIDSQSFTNRRKAKRFYYNWVKQFYNLHDAVEENINQRDFGGWFSWDNDKEIAFIKTNSRYIGEGEGIIFSAAPIEEKGYTPYC